MMQIPLIEWDEMGNHEMATLIHEMRLEYWHIRNLRKSKFGSAKLRAHYRRVAISKNKLMLAGIPKREVLNLIACLRLKCCARRWPQSYCNYCRQGRNLEDIDPRSR